MTQSLTSAEPLDLSRAERDIRARIGDRALDFDAMSAVSNIYRAATAVRNRIERDVLATHRLSWGGFTILFVLWIWGPQETKELAREAGVAKGTLTGMVKTLTQRGLVTRERHTGDGRRVIVRLTEDGHRTVEEVFPSFHAHEVLVTEGLTTQDQQQLAAYLRSIAGTARRE